MHEFSIVQALLKQCEDIAEKNRAKKVTKVEIKIGKLSGVEPHLLETAFNTFKEKTICDGAEFVMQIQNIVVKCRNCGIEETLEKNEFICPKCSGTSVEIIDGEDMYLMKLEME